MEGGDRPGIDYRFTLANERTFLAWVRTSLALVAGGLVAAKAIEFQHDFWRWAVAAPPILAGAVLAMDAGRRWRSYEDAMNAGRTLPVGRRMRYLGVLVGAYAVLALVAAALDG